MHSRRGTLILGTILFLSLIFVSLPLSGDYKSLSGDGNEETGPHVHDNSLSTFVEQDGNLRCKAMKLYNQSQSAGGYSRHSCSPRFQLSCTGKRIGRKALVLYMIHTKRSTRDVVPEMSNFEYFKRFGVLGVRESTSMFEQVDYIFTRVSPFLNVSEVTVAGKEGNVQLLWIPPQVCDLCAHRTVIEYLGGVTAVQKSYQFVVHMNAGARGPFQAKTDPCWIDVMAMGGLTEWDSVTSPPIMSSVAWSRQSRGINNRKIPDIWRFFHVQSYLIGLSASHLDRYVEHWKCDGDKRNCILNGEMKTATPWLESGGWLYELTHNWTIRSVEQIREVSYLLPSHNPLLEPIDVCQAMFVKFGGDMLQAIPERTVGQALHLTMFQHRARELHGRDLLSRLLQQSGFLSFSK